MRFWLLLALLMASVAIVRAQSSPTPDNAAKQPAAATTSAAQPSPSPSGNIPVEPPSLIPPNILPAPGTFPQMPTAPDLEQLNSVFKQTSLGKEADAYRLHLQMAALETRVRNDAQLHAMQADADRASTDLERRHRLRAYYKFYYQKIRALADRADLKAYLDAVEAAHELILLQPRVRHQTDEAEALALAKAKAAASVAPAPTPVQAKASEALHP